jgi:hypothetical protein
MECTKFCYFDQRNIVVRLLFISSTTRLAREGQESSQSRAYGYFGLNKLTLNRAQEGFIYLKQLTNYGIFSELT